MSSLKHTQAILISLIAATLSFSFGVRQPSNAQNKGKDDVWTRIDDKAFDIDALNIKPLKFAAFELDVSKLQQILRSAPTEFTSDARARTVIIPLPLPGGGIGLFRVEESPIMAPKLATRFQSLKSYSVKGLEDRTATGRLEFTPAGFHGLVISASGTFAIDPATRKDARRYISYFKTSLPGDPSGFVCNVDHPRPPPLKPRPISTLKPKLHHALPAAGDSNLRIYRIAVAASSEYVNAIHQLNPSGDPLDQAMSAILQTIDRVNAVYESELAMRFELIGDEVSLIYVNTSNDPYAGLTDLGDFLDKNQDNIDNVIGWNNYDVGHLFLAHGGGVADEPCACNYWYKAQGLTGRHNPQGDLFDIDYVAHELGHQFGARHSFNGTTLSCHSRSNGSSYEPGSGSTIMGYAGGNPPLCGSESVQDHTDDYFHAVSLSEISSFISNTTPQMGDSCARKVSGYDLAKPVVVGPGDFVVPAGTPFTLAVKNGWDSDGDTLVYNWEEFDLGDPDPPMPGDPNDVKKIRPLFRSRKWPAASRTFPQLVDLLNRPPAGTYTAESLPMNNRTMVFRATVRDQRGRYGYADSQIRVVAFRKVRPGGSRVYAEEPVGPFVVTEPAQTAVWPKGTWQTVRWSVANTEAAPVSCRFVSISLLDSANGNNLIVLAARVRNRGFARVFIPSNVPVGNARVKVEARYNIFFNLAAADVWIA